MAEDKKSRAKTLNKIFIIGGIIFAVALTVAGVIAINQSKEKGTDEVLSNESALISAIYNTEAEESEPLTDEQFYTALDKIFPKDSTTDADKRSAVYKLENIFSDAGISAEVAYFNNYGEPGYRIYTTSSVNDIIPLLDYSLCKEYYVHVLDAEGIAILGVYKINSDGVTIRMEQGIGIGNADSDDIITELAANLEEQYGISKITFTDKVLLIYSYEVSTADLLNAFDYTYQWCLQNDCDRQIFLYASDKLMAVTNTTLADDFYKKNYPVQELAATFRLRYYSAECFFGRAIQNACNIYL